MFSRPKILFLVSLLFVALLNPKFNPYLLFKFLIFYHSSIISYMHFTVISASFMILITYILAIATVPETIKIVGGRTYTHAFLAICSKLVVYDWQSELQLSHTTLKKLDYIID